MKIQDIGLLKLRAIYFPDNSYNSFFYLNKLDVPPDLTGSDIVTLKLRYGKDFVKTFYSSLGGVSSQTSAGFIGASPIVLQRLGLAENEEVFVSLTKSNPLTAISVQPYSPDDYNILSSVPNIMENIVLHQVRVVSSKQQMTLKIGNILIDLTVENMKPVCESGRLEQYTEVVVMDTLNNISGTEIGQYDHLSNYSSINELIWKIFKWGSQIFYQEQSVKTTTKETFKSPKEKLLAALKEKQQGPLQYRVVADHNDPAANIPTLCKINKLPELTVVGGSGHASQNSIECMVKIKEAKLPEVCLSKSLMHLLNVSVGSRVYLEKVSINKQIQHILNVDEHEIDGSKENKFTWQSFEKNINQVNLAIESWLRVGTNNNILITGPAGCGKSFFLKTIEESCKIKNLYSCLIDCKSLRGKKIENLTKVLLSKWSECAHRDPSLIILDDLDSLMYLNEEDGDNVMGAAYCRRIAELITGLFKSFQKSSKILVVATSTSVSSLGTNLATSRGPRLFTLIISITELTTEERTEIFGCLKIAANVDLVKQTNGFRIQDLQDLTSRAKLRAILEDREHVSEDDLKAALVDTVPMSLRGVKLQTDVPYKWSDVGGMEEVKSVLNEIFRWPSMYPDIFDTCPLKMQSGALLYGPPGCGKTLIAGALANECGMNFKSVKGPELLSKYVGASEAAVRDLFERAQQARPCLVFFDELDSLAPRRGADSTGVTDRVVNQLLTELDGVEGRAGVWVLGASSRPDLIDPALLRPGRLDRAVYCPLPSQEERQRIIEVLGQSLKLADNVTFDDVVDKTDGFTGADLQALLYNAQMKAIQALPDDMEDAEIIVEMSHLNAALAESNSSLSEIDRRKYEQISKRFRGVKDFQKTLMPSIPQRVTLA